MLKHKRFGMIGFKRIRSVEWLKMPIPQQLPLLLLALCHKGVVPSSTLRQSEGQTPLGAIRLISNLARKNDGGGAKFANNGQTTTT